MNYMNIWICNKCCNVKYDEPKECEFCHCGGKFILKTMFEEIYHIFKNFKC